MKIIFLDIDGVLNNLNDKLGIYPINQDCVKCFNKLIQETKANIVLISSWRYMIMRGDMKLKGFETMLRTHGVNCYQRFIGLTPPDDVIEERNDQVEFWLMNTNYKVDQFVILDDQEPFPSFPNNFIKTNWQFGLTEKDVERAISILNEN